MLYSFYGYRPRGSEGKGICSRFLWMQIVRLETLQGKPNFQWEEILSLGLRYDRALLAGEEAFSLEVHASDMVKVHCGKLGAS